MIDQALTKVKKRLKNPKPDSVRQAIDRLKKKVAETEASTASERSDRQGCDRCGRSGCARSDRIRR